MSRLARSVGPIYVGLEVHKDSISVAVLDEDDTQPRQVDRIGSDVDSVRRLVAGIGPARRLRVCYEAGPTRYELFRYLSGTLGVHCVADP